MSCTAPTGDPFHSSRRGTPLPCRHVQIHGSGTRTRTSPSSRTRGRPGLFPRNAWSQSRQPRPSVALMEGLPPEELRYARRQIEAATPRATRRSGISPSWGRPRSPASVKSSLTGDAYRRPAHVLVARTYRGRMLFRHHSRDLGPVLDALQPTPSTDLLSGRGSQGRLREIVEGFFSRRCCPLLRPGSATGRMRKRARVADRGSIRHRRQARNRGKRSSRRSPTLRR
jgi:hypothetical protein